MSEPFLAEVRMVGFNFAPRGWAFCDGQILPINQNQSLYSLLGTTYGGDGRHITSSQPDGNFTFTPGLRVDAQNQTRLNADISGNSFQGDPTFAGGSGIELRELNSAVFNLDGFGGGNVAAIQSFIDIANPGSLAASFVTSQNNNFGSGTATLPTATTRPNP